MPAPRTRAYGRAMVSRRLVLLVAIAALAPPAAARADTYAGWIDSPGNDDTMVVTAANGVASSFVMAFRAPCGNKERYAFHRTVPVGAAIGPEGAVLVATENAAGRFRAGYTGDERTDTLSFREHGTVQGTFGPVRAKGTLRIAVEATDALTGDRVTTCDSRTLRWELVRWPGRVYGGTTSQGEPVALFLDERRRAVLDFGFGWHTGCSSDDHVDVPDEITNFVIRGGRFGDAFPYADGAGNTAQYRFAGRVLSRARATGTISVAMQTSWGASCSTGRLRWSAVSG